MKNTYLRAAALRQVGLTALLAGAATTGVWAQALNYPAANTSTSVGTYTDLAGTGSAISTPNTDDANSGATDIGFSFTFGGTTFTQFVLNTNGFIRLGATAPTTPYFTTTAQVTTGGPLSSSTNTNLVVPLNTDLEAGVGGTEYRVSTTGTAPNRVCTIQWKNVSDKTRGAVPKQLSNISFQVKLYETSNAVEFVYGTATASTQATTATFTAVGLKGAGTATNQYTTVTKASNTPWGQATFQDGNYTLGTTPGNGFNIRNAPTAIGITPAQLLPEPGRTYRFDVPTTNDATIAQLYNIERLPAGQGFVYRAAIRNIGTNATSANNVTLTISGANSATQTQAITSLATGSLTTVTFNNIVLPNAGNNTVTVSLANDGNNANNSRTATTVTQASSTTSASTFSYIKPNVPINSGRGFQPVATVGPYTAAFCAAYTTNSSYRVTTVRAAIFPDANAVGETIYGVILDLNGNVLAQSAPVTIEPADPGSTKEFTLQTPVTVPAGTFLAGLAQNVNTVSYFPMGTQDENPGRSGTFYTVVGIDQPPGTVTDVSTSATPVNAIFMVEAGGFGTTLSTASAALTRAFTLYPNPSTDGLFNLAVRGANAPAGLSVEVVNQLGQRVYKGSARDNFTSTLDLGSLANGIYYMTLRNGDEFTTSKVSINR